MWSGWGKWCLRNVLKKTSFWMPEKIETRNTRTAGVRGNWKGRSSWIGTGWGGQVPKSRLGYDLWRRTWQRIVYHSTWLKINATMRPPRMGDFLGCLSSTVTRSMSQPHRHHDLKIWLKITIMNWWLNKKIRMKKKNWNWPVFVQIW